MGSLICSLFRRPSKRASRKQKKWEGEIKQEDKFQNDARETDLVIIVMGATGAGKSTFVNLLFDQGVAPVGHSPESCTETVRAYHLPYPEYPDNRVFLVDTPGFDDSKMPAAEIVRRIGIWLAQSYSSDMKVTGVIYCHNILQSRWSASVQVNFELFKKLCGPSAAEKTAIVTTKWDIPKDVMSLEANEENLKKSYLKELIDAGAVVRRSNCTREAARGVIQYLLSRNAPYVPLLIQKELVDDNRSMSKTKAGHKLAEELQRKLQTQMSLLKTLRENGASQDDISDIEEKVKELKSKLKHQDVHL